MDVYGILSLVFGILGTLSSYWYVGIVPCAIGAALGITGLIESIETNKTPIAMGLLLSILGGVMSVFYIVSDIDSGALALNAKRFGGEMVASTKDDDFMRFHQEGWTPEQEGTKTSAEQTIKEQRPDYSEEIDRMDWIHEGEKGIQENDKLEEAKKESNQEKNTEAQAEVSERATKSDNKSVYRTGETANCNGLELTFLGYTESSGTEYNSPSNGKVFVFPEFEVYNGTNEKVTMDTWTPFLYYCDGYNVETSTNAIFSMTELNLDILTGDIVQGGRMRACLPLELPSDWKEMEIFYKDNYFGDTEFSFQFNK